METIITTSLGLIQSLLSTSTLTSPLIKGIVDVVVAVTPTVIKEFTDLKPIVSNIIAVVKADPAALPGQLEALKASEVKLDADFEAAAAAAEADDASNV